MEKLSSILPSNSRIRSVDLKSSQASRPGTPNFGQRIGTTAATQDKVELGRAVREGTRALQETLAVRDPKEADHRRIAEETAQRFFDTRLRTEPVERNDASDEMIKVSGALPPKVTSTTGPSDAEAEPSQSLDLYA